jgi:hypothetical protein
VTLLPAAVDLIPGVKALILAVEALNLAVLVALLLGALPFFQQLYPFSSRCHLYCSSYCLPVAVAFFQ